ncbi:MAG: metalloregulator ArsR/SmtB family transcription factor [Bacteroidia bacterium]|nr:metalloregulator ArsR/SmtB family transcription factor [Bacteroidia bacterium]NND25414.1 winged helix-turn-helix transcriptional regulator [Flavobacteriaceae bacterium]MBT8279351.1 metalloregulator ArsR/SmtB family transcription factor [Bacteroidia bacterium]NNK60249.1 winged helix-turn-helix transcriptional regulator [Flavobacteriaceae bacterium]NNL32429.1 winged helix-turn-helix transcriptional regulator [Flavobacteriaceae bacterium]
MGASKVDIYSDQINAIAAIAKVFAHPARVAILKYISSQESCICNDIVDKIGLAQPTISQHLKVINEAGLLNGSFEGKSICYCLNVDRFQEIQEHLNAYFNQTKSNCC